jgi:hypothetical protein
MKSSSMVLAYYQSDMQSEKHACITKGFMATPYLNIPVKSWAGDDEKETKEKILRLKKKKTWARHFIMELVSRQRPRKCKSHSFK